MQEMIFPSVSGYDNIKTAMLCMLANQWDGKYRERIHILLHGKPGCGKTSLMEPLEKNWGALYLSMDPRSSALKGDARKEDHGTKLLNQYDGGIICVDDIELMKEVNTFRDVMEKGKYTITKGGTHSEYDARCRLVAATNDIKKMPAPILSRFDLVFKFDQPTITQSLGILMNMLSEEDDTINPEHLINHYFYLVQTYEPKVQDKLEIKRLFKENFQEFSIDDNDEGKEGRWIAGVLRLAKARSRLFFTDIGPKEVTWALEQKRHTDDILMKVLA